MKVRVRFNNTEVLAVQPIADDAEILGVSSLLVTTPDRAKRMLEAENIDITLLTPYL